ncbi:MAG: TRAP transporter substrate-binding protein [Rhodospirillales bacterium]|nr:MAG: TRAP transporter substrate-binding protein [Rhodospirillales bacterium]
MVGLARRAFAVVVAGALVSSPALAQEQWKVASAAQPGTALIGFVDTFAANATKSSGGKLVVERQFVGSEQEIGQQVVRGRLQIASVSFAGMSIVVPEGGVMNVPFLWASKAERDYVTEKFAMPVLRSIFDAKGLVIVGDSEVGYNGVVCKSPCPTPASVKGLKARIAPTAGSKMFWNQLGGNGVQLPLSELFPALEQNLVVACDLPFSYYITTPAATSAPYFVDTQHLHHPAMVVVNKAQFDKLPKDVQDGLRSAPVPVAETRRAVDAEQSAKVADFKRKGGTFVELTDAQRAEWRALVAPAQLELVKGIGGRAMELYEAIQKGQKEFAARPK